MRLELTGRHVDITPVLRRLVDRKLGRLERLLNDSAVSAQVVLTREKRGRRADVTLHARGEKFLHGVGESANWETSVSRAIDKIMQQALKVKSKWKSRKRAVPRRGPRAGAGPEAAGPVPSRAAPRLPRITRAARQAVKPMTLDDATREMEVNGEGVIVFRDTETAAIHVLFRRSTGELTLVETEA